MSVYSASFKWVASNARIWAIVSNRTALELPFDEVITEEMDRTRKGGTGMKFLGLYFDALSTSTSTSSEVVDLRIFVTVGTT